jgi:2-keto-3-deoxy-galactonokinase
MRGGRENPRPFLICECRGEGSVAWLHGAEGQFRRLVLSRIGARLAELLARPGPASAGASDDDDDVAYERGLTLAEDGSDADGDLDRALQRIGAGDARGAAAGALLAIGHDCARGLRLGRLGGPVALVGSGLLAERYSVALSRFGVAVRRIAPLRALREGCRLRLGC